MEARGNMELADNALARATQVFVKVWIPLLLGTTLASYFLINHGISNSLSTEIFITFFFCDYIFHDFASYVLHSFLACAALISRNIKEEKRQPEIHLFEARFRKSRGDISRAEAAYQLVHTGISPGLLEAIIKHANMEHRLGNLETAYSIYEQAIAIEKGKENSQTLPLLFAQYARFLLLVSGNADKAREILERAVESEQLSKPFLEAVIHLESIQPLLKRIDYLDSLVEKFIVPNTRILVVASVAEREEISFTFTCLQVLSASHRNVHFLDLFGDAQSIKKAGDQHAKLFLYHRSAAESKKQNSEDYLVSDKSKLAKSVISYSVPFPSVMGEYPSTQNPWGAGYGLQGEAWRPKPHKLKHNSGPLAIRK